MTRFIATSILFSGFSAALVGGCGVTFNTDETDSPDEPSESLGGAGGAGGASGEEEPDPTGGESGMGGDLFEPEPQPMCEPDLDSVDVPDDDFEDSNCDGIDGELERAIFVSPEGDNSAAGTIDAPVATIGAGIALGWEQGVPVYVCNAVYEERVQVETEGVDMYGGFDCETWQRSAERPTIFSKSGEPALVLANVDDVTIDGFVIESSDAEKSGDSSIAVAVNNSEGLVFKNLEIIAGNGAGGADGVDAKLYNGRSRKGADGGDAQVLRDCDNSCFGEGASGDVVVPACPDGTVPVRGGNGGRGADWDNAPIFASGATRGTYGGGAGGEASREDGEAGAKGARGENGISSGQSIGALNGLTYKPIPRGEDGTFGGIGAPGGGGAGAARAYNGVVNEAGGGGGQGGYQGCGGRPGTGGESGGASIGLLLVSSTVELRQSQVLAGNGGRGGDGGDGAPGRPGGYGGSGGSGANNNPGGDGGNGGNGGRGGDGGAGGGGPSFGIAQAEGALFTQIGGRVVPGLAGAGGVSRDPANNGIASFAAVTYEFL